MDILVDDPLTVLVHHASLKHRGLLDLGGTLFLLGVFNPCVEFDCGVWVRNRPSL
jgi:hypothetical protein